MCDSSTKTTKAAKVHQTSPDSMKLVIIPRKTPLFSALAHSGTRSGLVNVLLIMAPGPERTIPHTSFPAQAGSHSRVPQQGPTQGPTLVSHAIRGVPPLRNTGNERSTPKSGGRERGPRGDADPDEAHALKNRTHATPKDRQARPLVLIWTALRRRFEFVKDRKCSPMLCSVKSLGYADLNARRRRLKGRP
jgi:hypothetical protein